MGHDVAGIDDPNTIQHRTTIVFAVWECYSRIMAESGIDINDVAHLREALGLLGSLMGTTHDEVEIAVIGGSALLLDGIVVALHATSMRRLHG
jgi:hypothetical protein